MSYIRQLGRNRIVQKEKLRKGHVLQYILALLATATLSWITRLLACCILHITLSPSQAACGREKTHLLDKIVYFFSCVLHFCQCERVCRFLLLDGDAAAAAGEARWDDAKKRRWALVCKSL